MKVVTLTSRKLAPKVAQKLGIECVTIPYIPFKDGEGKYVLNKNLRNEEIVYIQSFYPDQFGSIVRTCFVTNLLLNNEVSCIKAVIPYLAFQRQDKPLKNESRNAEVALEILSSSGIKELYTVDPHSEIVLQKYSFYKGSLDPSNVIANYLKKRGLSNSLIVAPDKNAERKAITIAKVLDSSYVNLEKRRDKNGRVFFDETSLKNLKNIKREKRAVIVDDLASGGSTLIPVAKELRNCIDEIYAVVTHALIDRKSEKHILKAGIKEIISTDSVETKFSKISLADLIANLFKN
ncbi:MAG: ribose-phosphate diphosphokinase [Candidatus Aenigmatarchaeota archaeon]